jgi:predicted transcriptional regulator
MKKEWYVISNLDSFIDYTRSLVFNSFSKDNNNNDKEPVDSLIDAIKPEEQEELDKVLSHSESSTIIKSLLKKQINKKNKQIRFIITDNILYQIIESLNSRMVSNLLSQLVSKGLIETAFDEKMNDFVFWVNEKLENNKLGDTDE